jgi:hypothetical protein
MFTKLCWRHWFLAVAMLGLVQTPSMADDAKKAGEVAAIGEGAFEMPVPEGWLRKEPKVRIIEHEFEVSAAEGDEKPGRVTIMGAGGSIDDNIARWAGQFSQPDGSETSDKLKTRKATVAGQDVTYVDIRGTYEDKAGPFVPGPGVKREHYRMLAAIISTKKAGNYFIKFYGPENTITGQEANFMKMVEGLKSKG